VPADSSYYMIPPLEVMLAPLEEPLPNLSLFTPLNSIGLASPYNELWASP